MSYSERAHEGHERPRVIPFVYGWEEVKDFRTIFDAGKKDVLEYYFVEDERTEDPLAHIKADQ